MRLFLASVSAVSLTVASPALSDAPNVVADIAPLHSLVSMVMEGVGEPDLLLPPGVSPHGYAMKPSDAQALSDADVVFHVGGGLTPWLETPLSNLAGQAKVLEMIEAEGLTTYEFREQRIFALRDAGHDDHDHDDHGHKDHDDHGHDDHADHKDEHDHDDHGHDDHAHDDHDHEEHGHDDHGHDKHAEKHDGHDHDHEDHAEKHDDHDHDHEDHAEKHDEHDHDHEEHAGKHDDHDDHAGHDDHEDHAGHDHDHDHHHHDGVDPHAWLDPVNAAIWLDVIADTLSELDAENAEAYAENARAAAAELDGMTDEITAKLAPYGDKRFVVFHDAYQYFEARFGLNALGSISKGDATPPSPARLAELRDEVIEAGASCAFSEPQFNSGLIDAINADGTLMISDLDPLGVDLDIGPKLYGQLVSSMAESFAGCLSKDSSG